MSHSLTVLLGLLVALFPGHFPLHFVLNSVTHRLGNTHADISSHVLALLLRYSVGNWLLDSSALLHLFCGANLLGNILTLLFRNLLALLGRHLFTHLLRHLLTNLIHNVFAYLLRLVVTLLLGHNSGDYLIHIFAFLPGYRSAYRNIHSTTFFNSHHFGVLMRHQLTLPWRYHG